jgi:bacillithiol synthase
MPDAVRPLPPAAPARERTADLEIHGGTPLGSDPLLLDYRAGAAALEPFYAGHPGDLAAYQRKAAEVEARLDPGMRARLENAIEPLGDAGPRLRQILQGDGYFVTTGQQPALFGGPLYTLYKALAAIRLAEHLERGLGHPVLALFWVGADDHDWDEANHASLIGRHGDVSTLSVRGAPDTPPLPLSERLWGAGIGAVVEEFTALLPDTIHADAIRHHVREAYTPEATVAESFSATMRMLLAGQRIALVSSAAPALRRAAAPVLLREAEHSGAHGELVARQTARLEAAGYPGQVAVAADASNLMLLDGQGRDRLVRTRRGWQARRSGRQVGHGELLRLIADEPLRFSPNVLLRPVVENAVLPTIAYVAGPAELRYFAQIGCLFRAHGVLPPVVVPRPGALLVTPRVRRALDRLGLAPDELDRPYHELAQAQARAAMPAAIDDAVQRLREVLGAAYAQLDAAAGDLDPSLHGPVRSARNESLRRAASAERRILRLLKRREVDRMDDLRRAVAALRPGGAPQERVHSPLQFVAEHGPDVVAALAAVMQMEPEPVALWRSTGCGD